MTYNAMPSLTIEGKRAIIANARKAMGDKLLLQWLAPHNVPSLVYLNEHVRKFKAKFFRELYERAQERSSASR